MSCCLGRRSCGKRALGVQDLRGVVHAQSGLRDHPQALELGGRHTGHILDGLDQVNSTLELPHRALDLGVALVADHEKLIPLTMQFGNFHMDLGHQRAGCIKDLQAPGLRLLLHLQAHAVRAENQGRAARDLLQVLDKDRALFAQIVDHIGVVHDLMAHINGPPKSLQGLLDDVDRAVHAGTKTPGFGKQHLWHHNTPINSSSKVTGWPASGWLKSSRTAPSAATSSTVPA